MSKSNPVCPFCKVPISKDLEQYGGNCPHCLLEVPGDYAPTDPGLELRNKQKAEEIRKAQQQTRRNRMLMGVGAFLVLVLTVLGGWRYQAWKESLEYDPLEYYQLPQEDLTIAQAEIQPADVPNDPVKVNGGNAGGNGSKIPNVDGVKVNNTVPTVKSTNNPVASANPSGVRPHSPTPSPTDASPENQPALPDFGSHTSVDIPSGGVVSSGGGGVLSDRKEIEDMAARVIRAYNGSILACYQNVIKQIPDLKGIWTVSFTITPGGTTDNIRVKGAGISNPEMEACMQRNVGNWKFQKLSQEFKLAKQYRLSPSGW
jgi:hypothetical protein